MNSKAPRSPQSLDQAWTPRTMDGAWTRVVRRAGNGASYRISLSLSAEPAPPEGFPVVYLLDGEALFAGVAETAGRLARRPAVTGVGPLVVVGVGRAEEGAYDTESRHADYAPREGDPEAAFVDFLEDQVRPLIEAACPLNPSRRGLLGHSLAGYFVLHALSVRPEAFTAYGAISPSIWWAQGDLEARLAKASLVERKVLLAVGRREEPQEPANPDQERRAGRRMVSNVEEVAALLGARLHVLDDEDHASVVAPATTRFLRFLCELRERA